MLGIFQPRMNPVAYKLFDVFLCWFPELENKMIPRPPGVFLG